jgi:GH43 family beta-xylosidase
MRQINGPNGIRWYIYFVAGDNNYNDFSDLRVHVLESAGNDPMGPYTYKAQFQTNGYAIDGTVEYIGNQLYALWAGSSSNGNAVYIAPLSNPWTLANAGTLISQATLPWERDLNPVNEGPQVLKRNGKTYVLYAASDCASPSYAMGMLTLTNPGNVTAASSWSKAQNPVFVRNDAAGAYGPGFPGAFFKSPDGSEDWLLYHAKPNSGSGCGSDRSVRAGRFAWNSDDTPNFGVPMSTGTNIPLPSGDTGQ